MLSIGTQAPAFKLDGSHNTSLSDKELRGKFAVIIFYPANNTPG